jgi:hypothetical protein
MSGTRELKERNNNMIHQFDIAFISIEGVLANPAKREVDATRFVNNVVGNTDVFLSKEAFQVIWNAIFFSNDGFYNPHALDQEEMVPGVREPFYRVYEAAKEVIFLSCFPARFHEAQWHWLTRHNFIVDEHCHLVCGEFPFYVYGTTETMSADASKTGRMLDTFAQLYQAKSLLVVDEKGKYLSYVVNYLNATARYTVTRFTDLLQLPTSGVSIKE